MDCSLSEFMQYVEEEDIKFIRLAFCDVHGNRKNISIMPHMLGEAVKNGIPINASLIPGFGENVYPDLFLHPERTTTTLLPWRPENGKVIRKPKKKPNGEYTKKLYTQWEKANKYYEYIDVDKWECWYIETQYHIKEDKIINVYYDTNLDTINETNCDLLYDLIKADIVEKIDD